MAPEGSLPVVWQSSGGFVNEPERYRDECMVVVEPFGLVPVPFEEPWPGQPE